MEKNPIFKMIIIVSLIVGAISGILALIPPISFTVILLIMFFMAPFIIIYFRNLNLIKAPDIATGMTYGAVSGFFGSVGLSITFFPIAFVIDLIFRTQTFLWVKVVVQNFVFLLGTVFFISLLCALMNAFTGFLTAYILQYYKKGN